MKFILVTLVHAIYKNVAILTEWIIDWRILQAMLSACTWLGYMMKCLEIGFSLFKALLITFTNYTFCLLFKWIEQWGVVSLPPAPLYSALGRLQVPDNVVQLLLPDLAAPGPALLPQLVAAGQEVVRAVAGAQALGGLDHVGVTASHPEPRQWGVTRITVAEILLALVALDAGPDPALVVVLHDDGVPVLPPPDSGLGLAKVHHAVGLLEALHQAPASTYCGLSDDTSW